MIYIKAKLMREVDTGLRDELGNILYDHEYIPVTCRVTEWTADDVLVYGRDMTSSNRKVIIKNTSIPLHDIIGIKINNHKYDIHSISNLSRWILLIVKGWRV